MDGTLWVVKQRVQVEVTLPMAVTWVAELPPKQNRCKLPTPFKNVGIPPSTIYHRFGTTAAVVIQLIELYRRGCVFKAPRTYTPVLQSRDCQTRRRVVATAVVHLLALYTVAYMLLGSATHTAVRRHREDIDRIMERRGRADPGF